MPNDPLRLGHDDIDEIRKSYGPSAASVRSHRNYAAGKHLKNLTADMRAIIGSSRYHDSADNVLDLALRTTAGRLEFEGWAIGNTISQQAPGVTLESRATGAQEVSDFLQMFYLKSNISSLQYDTHYATLRDGITAVALRWKPGATEADPGRPTAHRENWWDGKRGVFIGFDDFDEPAWAVKEWTEKLGMREVKRRTVYYPDAIYRYIQDGGWRPFRLPDDPPGLDGYIPWTRADGTPLGLPIIPFSNSVADSGAYGRSDIAGLLAIQDDINQLGLCITVAGLLTSFQMYFVTGASVDEGKAVVGPGQLWALDNPAARAGAIPAGEVSALIDAYESKRQTIAINTATPMHIIGGDWPSGEALMRSEMPLVDKAVRLGAVLTPSWTLLGHRSTELSNRFGGTRLDEDAPITIEYAAPERLDELTEIQVQAARVDLYSKLSNIDDEALLIKTGLVTAAEARKMIADKAERAAAFIQTEAVF